MKNDDFYRNQNVKKSIYNIKRDLKFRNNIFS